MKLFCLLTTVLAMFVSLSYPQAERITAAEYVRAEEAAHEKERLFSRIVKKLTIETIKGKESSREERLIEVLLPKKSHELHTFKSGQSVSAYEDIYDGKQIYCRYNKRRWKTRCALRLVGDGFPSLAADSYSRERSTLDGKPLTIYKKSGTWDKKYPSDDPDNGLIYVEWKLYINDDGLIVREEWKHSYVDPARLQRESVTTYEYNPSNLKITAPIKKK